MYLQDHLDRQVFSIDLLLDVYDTERDRTIITAEILHAISAHDRHKKALTIEAGVVRVADALDMKEGRAMRTFSMGDPNIHSVSALAIDDVIITSGETPILIHIMMSNSSGIFQIDSLLKNKLLGSGLEKYITVIAEIEGEEKKILETRFEF